MAIGVIRCPLVNGLNDYRGKKYFSFCQLRGAGKLRINRLMGDKRALSQVMSIIIITVVTITMVIGASFWTGALSAAFTRFEKIEIRSTSVKYSGGNYDIVINYVNTGSSSTSVDSVQLNGVPCSEFSPLTTLGGTFSDLPSICELGVARTGIVTFQSGTKDPSGNILTAGVTILVTLHTTGGKIYHTSVTLNY